MDRPSSQLENARPTGLRLPSKLPSLATTKPLHDATPSDLNSRNAPHTTMLPPPSTISAFSTAGKHKIPGLPEPAEKVPRKTLSQRAGEPANQFKSHLAHKSGVNHVNGFGIRPTSKPGSYQNSRGQATANNIGSLRPSSSQTNGHHPGAFRQPAVATRYTQAEDADSDPEAGPLDRRKGILDFSLYRTLPNGGEIRKACTQPNLRHAYDSAQRTISTLSDTSDDSWRTSQSSLVSSISSMSAPPLHKYDQGGTAGASQPSRNVSLSTAFSQLAITPRRCETNARHTHSLERITEQLSPSKIPKYSCTPALRHAPSPSAFHTPCSIKHECSASGPRTPVTSARRGGVQMPRFLTKEKLSPVAVWDTNGRIDDIERMYHALQKQLESASDSRNHVDEALATYKARVQELQDENRELGSQNKAFAGDLERARSELHTTSIDLRQIRRDQEREVLDMSRRHERLLEEVQSKHDQEFRRLEREREKAADHFERKLEDERKAWQKSMDDETANMTTQHWEEMEEARTDYERRLLQMQKEKDALEFAAESRATESATDVQLMRDQIHTLQSQVENSNSVAASLRTRITTFEAKVTQLEQEKLSLVSKAHFLEGNQEAQSQEFTNMRQKMEDAIAAKGCADERSRQEEALRRKLNATILELRGNIRVFVRTRPLLAGEDDPAKVDYLDQDSLEGCKEMVVHGPTTHSATGKQRVDKQPYAFDRIFTPATSNKDVFEECRELIQSVVDGYNVSILSYGQTGSGKTYGMTGPEGIIPSSIRMLLSEMKRLQDKGWEYAVEASFVEVYNETLNDLLADAKTWDDGDDLSSSVRGKKKEKHEIHHDAATGKTTVSNLTSVLLWPHPIDNGDWPPTAPLREDEAEGGMQDLSYTERAVNNLLDTAGKNRRVAATKSNERSSRSHSVFVLTLKGSCAATNQSTEGVLNLVDLAGSEKLKQSGAEGNRLKETAAINKSLSALGDVIVALGNKNNHSDAHVPYRNSKLTYLLQSSLGGTTAGKSSRTLMLLHLSPLQAHWSESKSSLLFGSKANGTHIGTAKKK